jgi:1-acyl-sn-glycerol-3-phosphate acyltransferase
MMLKAKHNFFINTFFRFYTRWMVWRRFGSPKIVGAIDNRRLPILLIANHISWWDGFWLAWFNDRYLNRKFHFMMLESQLRKFRFFNFTGGYSVQQQSRSALESLQYTCELLQQPDNLVVMFPLGKIQSMHQQTFHFEKGLEWIVQHCVNPIQLVFVCHLVDYGSSPIPSLTIYQQEYQGPFYDIASIEQAYHLFYSESVVKQQNTIH